ncbi:hypothetical protein AVEN_105830-1 [Araneus ventricosus]|uniref:Uncharacterized protein n=1 Tax=Araneus ventricosus TaxID=182803 RepID=A0A4Y2M5K6_ARAVE|nr:hypothetical protein AVEN_105830-1 [Araneus ventricosus]
MSCENHQRYAHSIHLIVCDVLYKKRVDLAGSTVEIKNISLEGEEDIDVSEELIKDLNNELDIEFEGGISTDDMFHISYAETNSMTNINETIEKIKGIVKLYLKSSLKNHILQNYVKAEFGCEKMAG